MDMAPNSPGLQPDQLHRSSFKGWQEAQDRTLKYLRFMGIPPVTSLTLAHSALLQAEREITVSGSPVAAAMGALKDVLMTWGPTGRGLQPPAPGPDSGLLTGCPELEAFFASKASDRPHEQRLLPWMPPIRRSHMVPEGFGPNADRSNPAPAETGIAPPTIPLQQEDGPRKNPGQEQTSGHRPWERAARPRRLLLMILIFIPTGWATVFMAHVMPQQGTAGLEVVILVFYAVLIAWISVGFWLFVFGFGSLLRGTDRFSLRGEQAFAASGTDIKSRTAILVPIYHEDVDRVYAGIAASYMSLMKTGRSGHFDIFILSDSTDPDKWIEEEVGWLKLCKTIGEFNRIFYRRRRVNIKKKSGNIGDFCRRWGQNYDYMVVFDADSIMSGEALVRMVHIMDRHPKIGILQTVPLSVNQETLLARLQQFVSRVYGPVFIAGMHFFQLGEAHYWGHNAIIRTKPFMAHCALPRLSGKPPFGGDILSHDFVEAALMRKAGWEVWVVGGLKGSYEEPPPNLIAELNRDRRWCAGNMQHLRLMLGRGWFPASRMLFLSGAMSYLSGLFWFMFLSVSTAVAILQAVVKLDYFPSHPSLFPQWPVWNRDLALVLIASTAIILFLPKVLAFVLMLIKGGQKEFGGALRLFGSVVLEALLSALLSPIRMIFHSRFVMMTILGRKTGWGSQQREEDQTRWHDAWRYHGQDVLLGLIWGIGVFAFNPGFLVWLMPILAALLLSIPFSVWTSRATIGRRFRRLGLFLTPEEVHPPAEILGLKAYERLFSNDDPAPHRGFARAITDPCVNHLHMSMLGNGKRIISAAVDLRRCKLREKALFSGPPGLTAAEKREILSDPASLSDLHRRVWELPDCDLTGKWGL